MTLIKQAKQSPAIAVAVIALIAAVAGTAVAADPGGTIAKLDNKEKKQVKKIASKQANKRINRKAPNLSVDHANTAGSADAVADGGVTTASFAPDTRGVALAGAYIQENGNVSRWFNRFGGRPTVQQGDAGFKTVIFPGLGPFDARLIGQATLASGPGGEIAVQENEGNPRVITWASDGALTNRTFQLLIYEGSGQG